MKDFFTKCNQARRKLQILSYLLTKSLMENFNFWAVVLNLTLKNALKWPFFKGCNWDRSIVRKKEKGKLWNMLETDVRVLAYWQ